MKIIRPLLTLIGALTVAGILAAAVLFFYAPTLLHKEDQLEKADAIVVLAGNYYRPIYAAELYNKGYAPRLLISKPVVAPEKKAVKELGISFPFQWEIFEQILQKQGVKSGDYVFFGNANVSTIEEAEELKKALPSGIKSLILVTSRLHTRRAGTIFRETLPPGIKICVVSTPYNPPKTEWWKNYRIAPYVILEVAKTLYYELGGGFRSTEQIEN
ncbi:YdcF family protein [Desulfovibrio sp. JC010]|uniref:YdcF family protein n=1 Tax=Desulfovibrio sp. JC010 TaxID=2593641 RepID=UPI0013D6DF6A|nr:YdcF family protein [Desulfovibrio sp. JC010]NDV28486.1 YdcF family protein [Desulfovibrio sp. JC010]